MQFTDVAVVAGTRRREDGYLVADARIARTGIQLYRGYEVGKPEREVVRVYRPGGEVFAKDTLASAAHRPVTNDHPAESVTSENWKKHAVGQTGDEVSAEGIYIRVPLMVADEATIKLIEDGKRELSAGYTCDLDFTAGQTPAGDAYDAVQKNIRVNHVAIVARGRAGPEVRIGDAATWGAAPIHDHDEGERQMADKPLKTVTVDGLSIETTDQGAQVIEKLQRQIADANTALATAGTDHQKALAAKDAELAKKDAEIEKLKASQIDGAKLDKLVDERAVLVTKAKAIVGDVDVAGKTAADIRRAVVAKKLGDAAVKDKSDDYVEARFDILAADAKGSDPVRDTLLGGVKPTIDTAEVTDAYAAMVKDMQSAHQPAKAN